RDRLDLADLVLGLRGVLAKVSDGGVALTKVSALAGRAAEVLEHFAAGEQSIRLRELAHLSRPFSAEGGSTRAFATSEDSLTAYFTSFSTGCIRPSGGFGPSVIEFLSNPDYQMVRTYVGNEPVSRGVMRLFNAKTPVYSGPAIFLDDPNIVHHG